MVRRTVAKKAEPQARRTRSAQTAPQPQFQPIDPPVDSAGKSISTPETQVLFMQGYANLTPDQKQGAMWALNFIVNPPVQQEGYKRFVYFIKELIRRRQSETLVQPDVQF